MKFNQILTGNALELSKSLDDESISMVMTSPPYWGLRDYETEPQVWGGIDHEHTWEEYTSKGTHGGALTELNCIKNKENFQNVDDTIVGICKCGAIRCELGRELYPNEYIDHLCSIFDALKPKIAKWGSLYVNIGDTYYGGGQGYSSSKGKYKKDPVIHNTHNGPRKSMVGIPHMFVLEMINRGWILRNTIIWQKPSPMPTSATDRFTNDFEYLFFFVKNQNYWFKQQLEPAKEQRVFKEIYYGGTKYKDYNDDKAYVPTEINGNVVRNKRTTWNINSANFSGKHYAVFPTELCKVPIDASCPTKICAKCHTPYKYIKDIERRQTRKENKNTKVAQGVYAVTQKRVVNILNDMIEEKQCDCDTDETYSGVVLDPFFGRGTVAAVAMQQEKQWLGFELNPDNVDIALNYLKTKNPFVGNNIYEV